MAVKLTKEFYIALFVVACVALGLSIWAFATPCKKDKFGDGFKINGKIEHGNLDKGVCRPLSDCDKSCFDCNKDITCSKNKTCVQSYSPGLGWCTPASTAPGEHSEKICSN